MIHARLIAGVRGLDSGTIFAEGQQLLPAARFRVKLAEKTAP